MSFKQWLMVFIRAGVLCAIVPAGVFAARVVDKGPIVDSLYMIHFLDGEYSHSTWGQSTQLWLEKLDTTAAKLPSTYTITSADDADFSGGKNPVAVGKKSKAADFNGWNTTYFQEHYIFLALPNPMKRGKSYTISMGSLGNNITLTYNEFTLRSEAIHVNQYGYSPVATAKYAYISMFMGTFKGLELEARQGAAFHVVRDGQSTPLFSGTIGKRKDLETGGADYYPECRGAQQLWYGNTYASTVMADVWECNFTGFAGEAGYTGNYRVVVEGMGSSFPFRMDNKVYFDAWKDCMHGIFMQRSACAKDASITPWAQPARHAGLSYKETSAQGANGSECAIPSLTGQTLTGLDGGYYDAADYDKWTDHLDVTRSLCWAYELRPSIFSDGDLAIPENANNVPDILDEAAWMVAWCLRGQTAAGGIRGSSWECNSQWYIGPAETRASLYFSAEANHLALCMEMAGVTQITGPYYNDVTLTRTNLLAKAKAAYDYAMAQSDKTADFDKYYYAQAMMYRVTGDAQYQTAYKTNNPITTATTSLAPELCSGSTNPYSQSGSWWMEWPVKTYLMTNHANRDAAFYNTQKEAFINWFTYDRLEMSQTHQPFRRGGHRRMPPVVGEIAYANTYPQAIAYFGLGLDQQWLDPIYTSCDYTLGGNPLNMCFMANCGQRWLKEVMHDTYSNPLGVAKGIQSYHQMGSFGLLVSATNVVSAGTFGWTTLRPM